MMKKKIFNSDEVHQALGLSLPNNDIKDVLKIVNHPFVPEPELFNGCPVLINERNDGKKDIFAVWREAGIAVHRYPGRFVYWLLKFNSSEKFDPVHSFVATISCDHERHSSGNLIDYFSDVEQIASAIIYITNAHKAEQILLERQSRDTEKIFDNDHENGEYRYNSDKGKYEYFPDWLGGMESEEDFWEH